jgi:protease-4
MSITGSIGVTSSYVEYAGFLERYNFTYRELTTGDYKDVGSPFRKLLPDEKEAILEQMQIVHEYFVEGVAENRNLEKEDVEAVATGMYFVGAVAKEKGFVDVLGGWDEAIGIVESRNNITAEPVEYSRKKSILDLFSEVSQNSAFYVGKGIGFLSSRKLFI